MSKSKSLKRTPAETAGVLKTGFVSQDQSAVLTEIVELSLEQIDSFGGGLTAVAMDPCNCCHKPPAV